MSKFIEAYHATTGEKVHTIPESWITSGLYPEFSAVVSATVAPAPTEVNDEVAELPLPPEAPLVGKTSTPTLIGESNA